MKLRHPLVTRALGFSVGVAARLLRWTIDWRAIYLDPALDTVHPHFCGRYVFACWHESMIMPVVLRADARMLALASRHHDGEILTHALRHLGWSVARGSSARGGSSGLLQMLRADERFPNLTPDGPRGPRRRFSPGAIYLAARLELPLVCVGYGYRRPWRLNSWDRFAIPRPFSRGRAVFGPALRVPADLDRDGIERYRAYFERHLTWLTEAAQSWAESGETRAGELRMFTGRASPEMQRLQGVEGYEWPAELGRAWNELAAAAKTTTDTATVTVAGTTTDGQEAA
ncbi:MAG: DUF374 domain-containing protein [Proteobacteria bacterium]|nr:DUF374 domain-containing protein [Pseudomonadota bacterium]